MYAEEKKLTRISLVAASEQERAQHRIPRFRRREIDAGFASVGDAPRGLTARARARCRAPMSGVFVVVHFPPSRTSRPAGCRSTAAGAVSDASPVTRTPSNPRSPGRLPGGTHRYQAAALTRGSASRPSQARATVHGGLRT
ncbi:hypothetical protein PUN28_020563 [Cardiocondyla obscurior]|uniref:Uncharacterized protein n=1 Tax=Cardiocondyla obscurior TaxID=286306 RepID=A0AAW2EAD8_9HYME